MELSVPRFQVLKVLRFSQRNPQEELHVEESCNGKIWPTEATVNLHLSHPHALLQLR